MKLFLPSFLVFFAFGTACQAQGVLAGPGYIDVRDPGFNSYTLGSNVTGPRFVWSPNHRSLWFGVSNVEWNLPKFSSFAGGENAFAGDYSFAWLGRTEPYSRNAIVMGGFARAKGDGSVALGFGSFAEGRLSIAIGVDAVRYDDPYFTTGATTAGELGVAIGSAANAGYSSTAVGPYSYAESDSAALGSYAMALNSSIAMGMSGYAANGSVGLLGVAGNNSFAAIGGSAEMDSFAAGYLTNARNGAVALGRYNIYRRRDNSYITAAENPLDPIFELGNPTTEWMDDGEGGQFENLVSRNAITIYRDNWVRLEGPLQLKAGSGYLTIQPGGAVNRTLILPDIDGTLVTNASPLPAANISGVLSPASLPSDVTRVGATIELDSAETAGDLPWSRVSSKPATLAANAYPDALPVQRETINGVEVISTALRIKPQGDIPMFGATP